MPIMSEKFAYRTGTDDDRFIIPEVLYSNEYRFNEILALTSDFRKLALFDLGAHIGAFSRRVLDFRKDTHVFAYEPEITNFHFLSYNLHRDASVKLHFGAVGLSNGIRWLCRAKPAYTGRHRITDDQSSEATKMFCLAKELRKAHSFDFTIIKMDIEGGEKDLIEDLANSGANVIVLETHDGLLNPIERLLSNGYRFWFHPFSSVRHAVYLKH